MCYKMSRYRSCPRQNIARVLADRCGLHLFSERRAAPCLLPSPVPSLGAHPSPELVPCIPCQLRRLRGVAVCIFKRLRPMMRGGGRHPPRGSRRAILLVAAAALVFAAGAAGNMMHSLPEGPGLLAPRLDLLPAYVSSRACSDRTVSARSGHGDPADAPSAATLRAGVLRGRDVILPDACRDVGEALELASSGDRLFFREGSFAWEHVAVVGERLHIAGDDRSCLLGAWLLQEKTAGLFQGVCCATKHQHGRTAALPDATITSFSASWVLEDCEIRAVHAPVLRLLDAANITLLSCNIGGVGSGQGAEGDSPEAIAADEDLLRATDAVVALSSANVLLYRCRVEDTGHADSRPPRDLQGNIIAKLRPAVALGRHTSEAGRQKDARNVAGKDVEEEQPEFPLHGGIRAFDAARVRLEQCTTSNNDVTLTLAAQASAVVRRCELQCGQEGFSLLRAVRCQPKSRLVLRGNRMSGKKWLDAVRPATVADDEEDELTPWEIDGVSPAISEAGREGGEDSQTPVRRGRGRRPQANTKRQNGVQEQRRPRGRPVGGGGNAASWGEDSVSAKDLAVLRLRALGIFDAQFDKEGRLILPPSVNPQSEGLHGSRGEEEDGSDGAGATDVGGDARSTVEGLWEEYAEAKSKEAAGGGEEGQEGDRRSGGSGAIDTAGLGAFAEAVEEAAAVEAARLRTAEVFSLASQQGEGQPWLSGQWDRSARAEAGAAGQGVAWSAVAASSDSGRATGERAASQHH